MHRLWFIDASIPDLPFAKLIDGLTCLANLVIVFNVFVRQFITNLCYCFTNNVLEIFVTDWGWDVRDLEAFSSGILGNCPTLSFVVCSLSGNRVFTLLWHWGLISFNQTLPSCYVTQQPSHCLLNPCCFASLQVS